VPAFPIVEHLDVFKDVLCCLVTSRLVPTVHELTLECPEEAFDTGIVPAVACAAHARDEAVRLEDALVARGRILAAAVRVIQESRRNRPIP